MSGRTAVAQRQAVGVVRWPLARLGFVLLIWAEWMGPLRPVHHLQDPVALALGACFLLASSGLLFGWRTSITAVLTGVFGFMLWMWVPTMANLESWMWLSACTAMCMVPAGARWSLDALAGRVACDRGGGWLFRLGASSFFVGAALHQLQPAFLFGVRLEQLMLARFGVWLGPPSMLVVAAVLVVVLELAIGLGVWTRWQTSAVAAGVFGMGAAYVTLHLGTLGLGVSLFLVVGLPDAVWTSLASSKPDTCPAFVGVLPRDDQETSC